MPVTPATSTMELDAKIRISFNLEHVFTDSNAVHLNVVPATVEVVSIQKPHPHTDEHLEQIFGEVFDDTLTEVFGRPNPTIVHTKSIPELREAMIRELIGAYELGLRDAKEEQ